MTTAEGTITAESSRITALESTIPGLAQATAVQELTTRVTATENVDGTTTLASLARWLVKTTVNGLTGGVGLINDGDKTRFYVERQIASRFSRPASAMTTSLTTASFPSSWRTAPSISTEARIRDGSIDSLKAGDAFLTNMEAAHGVLFKANIGELDADNIEADAILAHVAAQISADHLVVNLSTQFNINADNITLEF